MAQLGMMYREGDLPMFRLIVAACVAALLTGCINASVDPTTSRIDGLPDLSGRYDMSVGEAFAEQMSASGKVTAILRREDNHYRLMVIEDPQKGAEPQDEYVYLGGPADRLAVVYAKQEGEEAAVLTGRRLADGSIEVLMATVYPKQPGSELLAPFARHGLTLVDGTYAPELEGIAKLPDLAEAMWDPAVIAAYQPKVVFRLVPEGD